MAIELDANNDSVRWGDFTQALGAVKLTVSYRFRPNFAASVPNSILLGQASGLTLESWLIHKNADVDRLIFRVDDNAGFAQTQLLTDGVWQHFHWVFDGALVGNARLELWTDKVLHSLNYFGTLPAALGSTADVLALGQGPDLFASSVRGDYAELNIWVGAAITGSSAIANIYDGCASLILPSFLELDSGLLVNPPVDRSKNSIVPTTTGALVVVAHPPDAKARTICGGTALLLGAA